VPGAVTALPALTGRAARAVCAAGAVLAIAVLIPGCLSSTTRYAHTDEETARQKERLAPLFDTSLAAGRRAPDTLPLCKVLTSYLGTPYLYGGMSRDGVDCSGLVCLVFRETWNMRLPRSATGMIQVGTPVPLDSARPGDLVFFRWGYFGGPDHVGIYTGAGRFVHASTRLGVIESSLADNYYGSHFIAMRRMGS